MEKNIEKKSERAMRPKFAVGDRVRFGEESWTVVKFHKIGTWWEILFRSAATGVHRSLACKQLELYVDG